MLAEAQLTTINRRYILQDWIGAGSMGAVYSAMDRLTGQRVALNLRFRDRPGRLVVWKTSPEPEDTADIRKRLEQQKRDPQDVPDRQFYPRPRRALKTLEASNGRSYQYPRWLPDSKRAFFFYRNGLYTVPIE